MSYLPVPWIKFSGFSASANNDIIATSSNAVCVSDFIISEYVEDSGFKIVKTGWNVFPDDFRVGFSVKEYELPKSSPVSGFSTTDIALGFKFFSSGGQYLVIPIVDKVERVDKAKIYPSLSSVGLKYEVKVQNNNIVFYEDDVILYETVQNTYIPPYYLYIYNKTPDTNSYIAFIDLDGISVSEYTSTLSEYSNDVYYKLNNILNMMDIDFVYSELAQPFNFCNHLTDYSPETNTYTKSGELREFDNVSLIKDKISKQYLYGFDNYFNSIDENLTATTENRINSLKTTLIKNIANMNGYKGNKYQISFLLSIFTNATNYKLISVDEDPYTRFAYRISSDMPELLWLNSIKEITHPLGWRDTYIQIPDASSGVPSSGYDTWETMSRTPFRETNMDRVTFKKETLWNNTSLVIDDVLSSFIYRNYPASGSHSYTTSAPSGIQSLLSLTYSSGYLTISGCYFSKARWVVYSDTNFNTRFYEINTTNERIPISKGVSDRFSVKVYLSIDGNEYMVTKESF